jgi:hypothetical protein
MKEYTEWLENQIEICLEDKDLQREHWAFCRALNRKPKSLDEWQKHHRIPKSIGDERV